jgi:UDP-N-acetylmuramate dehydrogenase
MEFGYDASRLQRTGEAVVWAEFGVTEAEPAALRARARESLTYRKRTQPLAAPSAGCIFRNPDPVEDRIPDGVPSSAGALVDRAGLKGRSVGRAVVSPVHGNFVVSDGDVAPSDIRRLVELCRAEVHDRFGIVLQDEIVYLGEFDA